MSSILSFLMENYELLLSLLFALLTVASLVTKLTPSPKDDEVVKKILAYLSFLQPKGVAGLKAPLSVPKEPDSALFRERTGE